MEAPRCRSTSPKSFAGNATSSISAVGRYRTDALHARAPVWTPTRRSKEAAATGRERLRGSSHRGRPRIGRHGNRRARDDPHDRRQQPHRTGVVGRRHAFGIVLPRRAAGARRALRARRAADPRCAGLHLRGVGRRLYRHVAGRRPAAGGRVVSLRHQARRAGDAGGSASARFLQFPGAQRDGRLSASASRSFCAACSSTPSSCCPCC